MPDEPEAPMSADAENNTPEAPPSRPGPLQPNDKADLGCLILFAVAVISLLVVPAGLLLGGAPVILPAITALILVVVTPMVNPAERMAPGARWTGRVLVFLLLAGLIGGAWYWLAARSGEVMIRE